MAITKFLEDEIKGFVASIDKVGKGRLADSVILLDDTYLDIAEDVREYVGAVTEGDIQVWMSGSTTLGFRLRNLMVVGSVGRCHEEWMRTCFRSKVVTGSQAEEYLREAAA